MNIFYKSYTEIKHNKERNIDLLSQVDNLSFVLSVSNCQPSKIAGKFYRTSTFDGTWHSHGAYHTRSDLDSIRGGDKLKDFLKFNNSTWPSS